jgi:hypothetical protein
VGTPTRAGLQVGEDTSQGDKGDINQGIMLVGEKKETKPDLINV